MNKPIKILVFLSVAVATAAFGLIWNGNVTSYNKKTGLVTEAQAIIGRPLTPLSFAGVARRTVRRCAVGVYYC
jgi:hypothetical protein